MSEEEQNDTQPAEQSAEQPQPTNEADSINLIEKAEKIAERLEAANKETAKLIEEQQKLNVEKTLSGSADAGVTTNKKTKEQIAEENARKFLRGTGMEEYAFPNAKTDNSYN